MTEQHAVIGDLADEIAHLDALLFGLEEAEWRRITAFREWSVFDHVGHLCISDRVARQAIEEPDAFAVEVAAQMGRRHERVDWKGVSIPRLGAQDGEAMRLLWYEAGLNVARGLAALKPGRRVPWYGSAMSIASFATARLMETWAHGETIRDALNKPNAGTARLRHVCELGWRTRGFALNIHHLPASDAPVHLALKAPDQTEWTWGKLDAPDRIEGSARDFARVVCQCRNIADTSLSVIGDAAMQWMQVAQCFVGGPSDPPAPGVRKTEADMKEET